MLYDEFCRTMCVQINGLLDIPTSLYKNGIQIFNADKKNLSEIQEISQFYYRKLANDKILIAYEIISDSIIFCLIKAKDDYSFLFGPICISEPSERETYNLMHSVSLNKNYFKAIHDYLIDISPISYNYAIQLFSFFYLTINQETLSTSQFILTGLKDENKPYEFDEMVKYNEKLQYKEVTRHTSYDFETKMLYFVQTGDPKSLLKLFSETPLGHTGTVAKSALRQEKNNMISSITLSTRAAITGGLNKEIAFRLSDITMQKIEYCSTIREINQINHDFIMDLCSRVAALKVNNCESPIIKRCIDYIGEHLCDKIKVEDLAIIMKTNRSFLSSKFKAETGISLNEYINRQKIDEAKKLLIFSDICLSEITTYLSFASQSHFQNTFRKLTGLTPAAYRKTYKK